MTFGTWNVRSLYRAAAFRETIEELNKFQIDVCGLQEIRWPGKGILQKKEGTLFYSGSSDERNQLGCAIYVSKRLSQLLTDFEAINDRICKLGLSTKPHNITVITAHAPTEDKDDIIKDRFYAELERVCDQSPRYDMKIMLGDFNAKIGKESNFSPTIGKQSLHNNTNNNGFMVIDFAASRNLAISSTWFPHKDIHKMTWKSPDGKIYNQIDHIIVDKRYASPILDVRSKRGANIDSDHFLVTAKIRTKLSHKNNSDKQLPLTRWGCNKLKDRKVEPRFELTFIVCHPNIGNRRKM